VFVGIEIEILYERFLYIDRNEQGYITTAELLLIPEFSSNPLSFLISSHLETAFSSGKIYFATFLEFLEIFSSKSPREKRIKFLFEIFDLGRKGRLDEETLVKIHEMMVMVVCREESDDGERESEKESERNCRDEREGEKERECKEESERERERNMDKGESKRESKKERERSVGTSSANTNNFTASTAAKLTLKTYDKNNKGYLTLSDFKDMYLEDKTLDQLMVIDFMEFLPQKKSYGFWELILPNFSFGGK